jgi:hypothetical protein
VNVTLRRSLVVLAACAASPALADETKPAPAPQQPAPAQPAATEEPIRPPGSSDDLNAAIDSMRPRHAGILPNGPVSLIDPVIDDVNKKLYDSIGLKFGLAYTTAYQRASDGEDKDAAAGDVDLYARWRVLGEEKSGTRSVLGVYSEYRHDFGEQVPRDLSQQFGSLWRTTNGLGRQDPEITQAWWEQHLADDRLVVTIGKLDADNYYNEYRYQSDSRAFMSQAFSSNPARMHPGNGLGFNALARVVKDWYVSAGAQDANGTKSKSGFHTIDEGDWFSAVEVGWTPTFENFGKGAYRLEVWHTDAATIEGFDEDRGVALSCEQEICKSYVPFLRAAWSDGDATGVSEYLAAGIGLEGLIRGKDDLTGIAVAWGRPEDSSFDDQVSAEVFHRFQIAPDVQITLGYQYYVDPSFAPASNDDPVGVFEVRVRIEF